MTEKYRGPLIEGRVGEGVRPASYSRGPGVKYVLGVQLSVVFHGFPQTSQTLGQFVTTTTALQHIFGLFFTNRLVAGCYID